MLDRKGGDKMKNKRGFTLVELLVVIAIIGILSSVAIVNLNSAKQKARAASVQAALSQLTTAVIICHDDNLNLTPDGGTPAAVCDGEVGDVPAVGRPICAGSTANWPTIDTTFTYSGACDSTIGTSWSFAASDGTKTVTCTQTGCAIS
ncbi:MAG: hypothetical protein COV55_02010 [Candidatus Komeilibacteria bacterium CG11_big_fil_rev_8_21_14_0_20_36_20]|uniref:Prepilin-type cleavage/methylation domain-containing protein n=1 Tax=Candidatus Komeilibacteria bacterium CG11_big_fil_rev_8_21_14_0_20_36_20 TaxID=1974477 RepID=A0A2H0ND83_9BACT|nr:MAG: hypothetical protein COV55_02010 [Candidatus Komeilibacteria bacterium CG11_big_fil_rev_8_21_14_0_20_36_20]PIR81572.1 MAG: hypothetical protein COU21_02820 [Candidatus Komeilibacteria bacterium CG10_big_fil_rev_8_21_14_0_10_36_65]PJC55410.1 MAG: hypothetical protein CO027_02120 [Candidatus Komeilibacteria bacterium CG_4_9_14_0_2_um_filter_36_13]